jgi:hypothetical protein
LLRVDKFQAAHFSPDVGKRTPVEPARLDQCFLSIQAALRYLVKELNSLSKDVADRVIYLNGLLRSGQKNMMSALQGGELSGVTKDKIPA